MMRFISISVSTPIVSLSDLALLVSITGEIQYTYGPAVTEKEFTVGVLLVSVVDSSILNWI